MYIIIESNTHLYLKGHNGINPIYTAKEENAFQFNILDNAEAMIEEIDQDCHIEQIKED